MQYKSLNIYRDGITPPAEPYTFYILRIGNNAGKPLKEPCANCYAFRCNNNDGYVFYYWLAYGLWQGKMFMPYLRGSVINFIIKSEFLQVVKEAESKVKGQYEFYMKTLKTVNVYEKKAANLLYQAQLLQTAKQVMLRQLLK